MKDLTDAILADPQDSNRVLVYADWLEDQGDVGFACMVRESVKWRVKRAVRRGESPAYLCYREDQFFKVYLTLDRSYTASVYHLNTLIYNVDVACDFYLYEDGTATRDKHNWSWLVALIKRKFPDAQGTGKDPEV